MTTALSTDQLAGTTRVLIIEDDPSIAEAVRRVVAKQNGTGVVVERRPPRPAQLLRGAARPGRPRHRAPRDGRLGGARAHPRPLRGAGADPDRPRPRAREGTRPHQRRRRLPDEALRRPGARRPHPGPAAPQPGRGAGPGPEEPTVYRDGNLEVDWPAREVRVDGEVVGLTKLEFQLLQTFVRHPGQALATQQLLEQVWNDPFGIGPERVKFTVLRLRRKLGWQDEYKDVLEAIRGYGYRYTPMGDRAPDDRRLVPGARRPPGPPGVAVRQPADVGPDPLGQQRDHHLDGVRRVRASRCSCPDPTADARRAAARGP